MEYRTYAPSSSLSKYIQHYWTLEATGNSFQAGRERIFPDGCMELIFHHGDVFRKHERHDIHTQPRSFIHGQIKQFIEVESTGNIGVFSIRFIPNGLYPFVPCSVEEFTGTEISVFELWGSEGSLLEEKIMEASSTILRIQIIEAHLLRQLRNGKRKLDAIDHCVASILAAPGTESIERLSSETGIGERHLERQFKRAVGISPKFLTRVVRFQKTLQVIQSNPSLPLTRIAYENGFYDQSHFIKDFKEFTGLNPKHYFDSQLDLARYLVS